MNTYTIEQKRQILDSANGQIFSVRFIKKDGSVREMTCKKWIEKAFTTGSKNAGVNTVSHKPEYYTAADLGCGEFRNINLNTLISCKVGGKEHNFS